MSFLTPDEQRRYSRHLALPQFGEEGQKRLKAGRVLLVGVGGLGSPCATYLTAAGVGTLGLVDADVVDLSNLQRQTLYREEQVGQLKVAAAAKNLQDLNPLIETVPIAERFSKDNASRLLADFDVVVDGTDNFHSRYVINDACVLMGRPLVHGSIFQFDGQISVFNYQNRGCYRCVYPEPPTGEAIPSCAEAGVLGVLPGIVGTLQATEVIKVLTGIGETLAGRILVMDVLGTHFRPLAYSRNPDCAVCGVNPWVESMDLAGESRSGPGVVELTPNALCQRLGDGATLTLVDVREPVERELVHLGGVHIPLGCFREEAPKLKDAGPIVVYCHHGVRSREAGEYLVQLGFPEVYNLSGGIDAWAGEVDPTMVRY